MVTWSAYFWKFAGLDEPMDADARFVICPDPPLSIFRVSNVTALALALALAITISVHIAELGVTVCARLPKRHYYSNTWK